MYRFISCSPTVLNSGGGPGGYPPSRASKCPFRKISDYLVINGPEGQYPARTSLCPPHPSPKMEVGEFKIFSPFSDIFKGFVPGIQIPPPALPGGKYLNSAPCRNFDNRLVELKYKNRIFELYQINLAFIYSYGTF